MKDESKTKKQLIAELEELRRRLPAKAESSDDASPAAAGGGDITRRELLRTAWVAPVILTIAARPEGVLAQVGRGSVPTTSAPTTPEPTQFCPEPNLPTTPEPTVLNTFAPTTAEPTGQFSLPTTSEPTTAAPTLSLGKADGGSADFPTVDSSAFQAVADAPTAAEDLFRFKS